MKFSYSRLSLYKECPKKFWYKYIDKSIISTDSPIFEKGKFIHALIETYPNLPAYEFKFEEVRSKMIQYITQIFDLCATDKKMIWLLDNCLFREKQFYLNHALNNCTEEDGSLVNGIIDYVGMIGETLIIADWKTGQTQKYASFEQLKLYSIWAFNEFPEINSVRCFFFFIEQNKTLHLEIKRSELSGLKLNVLSVIDDINKDTVFKKKPADNCKYCDKYNDCKPYNVQMKGKTNG
jgi:CRISPR/Cas system-associated exonuclease Cas4 (RecB family)